MINATCEKKSVYECDICGRVPSTSCKAIFGFLSEDSSYYVCPDCVGDRCYFGHKRLEGVYDSYEKWLGEDAADQLYELAKKHLPQIFILCRPKIPDVVRANILMKYGYTCVSCGSKENLSIDHIKPYSKGGGEDEEILQVLCRSCNSKKGAKTDAEGEV